MDLDVALKGMFDCENALRSKAGIHNPTFMSEQMMRLSQYLGAVEVHLSELEKEFAINEAILLEERLLERRPPMPVTKAEREVDIKLAETKGQIKYLTRLVKSGWSQIGTIQSRINHLVREAQVTSL